MAKRGFRIMDSDLHTMEPDDLCNTTKAKILGDSCARLYPLATGR